MKRASTIGMAVLAFALSVRIGLAAEDPPALNDAGGANKESLRALIAQATKEGSLSYWDTVIQSKTNAALVEGFRAYYGLPAAFAVNYSLSTTTGMVTRVEQEIGAGRVTMDVAAVASVPWVFEKTKAGNIMHYDSPQYPLYRAAFAKGLGSDGYFAFNGAYVFVPMWNPEKMLFKGSSWRDVIGAAPVGRLSMGDSSKSQTYLATYMGLKQVLGIDYFKRLAEMKPVFLVRSEQIASQLVTGQNLLAFSGMPTRAYQVNERGAKLQFIMPTEGVVLLPQSMFILAAAPHPAAARLWVDFILSDLGQKIMVDNEAMMSGRSGFKSPVPQYAPPIDDLKVINVDWEKTSTADMEKARAEWQEIFNP
jgi:iron(III) transport system substrate-binding protein